MVHPGRVEGSEVQLGQIDHGRCNVILADGCDLVRDRAIATQQ
jgi:hypothetical protein